MPMTDLCAPALIYLMFSIVQILIDSMKGLYNTALVKGAVMVVITFLLNMLCKQGLGVVSWIIVFLPFLFMTVVVTVLLYVFGLDAASGSFKSSCEECKSVENVSIDENKNIVVFDPYYDEKKNPVQYKKPYIVIPQPVIMK
jgi:hypothetical protein